MRKALHVAREALSVGEVPVGCVIVQSLENGESVVVSHGANQVNATRDATRHAEVVAIDRMLTQGKSSDRLRLPPSLVAKAAHGAIPADSPLQQSPNDEMSDKWVNVPENLSHWKNEYGWGNGKQFTVDSFSTCDLYVTCEPCIMCAAALARVGIRRVYFGCYNDKFGGCGSILKLHKPNAFANEQHTGYPIEGGILKDEAVTLLRSFYDGENFHAPHDKRKRKS